MKGTRLLPVLTRCRRLSHSVSCSVNLTPAIRATNGPPFCEAVTYEMHFYVSHSRTAASGRRARVSVWIDECSRLVGWTSVPEWFGCVSECGCRLLSGGAALAARSRYGVWRCWIGSGGFLFPKPPAFDRRCWRCLDGVLFLDDQSELVSGTQGVISSLVFTPASGPSLHLVRCSGTSRVWGGPDVAG